MSPNLIGGTTFTGIFFNFELSENRAFRACVRGRQERSSHSGFKIGQIIRNRPPDDRQINLVVFMPQQVPHVTHMTPGNIRHNRRSPAAKSYSRLADNEKFPLDGGDGHRVATECLKVHSSRELLDHAYGVENITQSLGG
jgi:hypothetical protein